MFVVNKTSYSRKPQISPATPKYRELLHCVEHVLYSLLLLTPFADITTFSNHLILHHSPHRHNQLLNPPLRTSPSNSTMGIPFSKQINVAFDQVTPLVAAGFEVLQTTKNITFLLAAIQILTVVFLGLILVALLGLIVTVSPDLEEERVALVTPAVRRIIGWMGWLGWGGRIVGMGVVVGGGIGLWWTREVSEVCLYYDGGKA